MKCSHDHRHNYTCSHQNSGVKANKIKAFSVKKDQKNSANTPNSPPSSEDSDEDSPSKKFITQTNKISPLFTNKYLTSYLKDKLYSFDTFYKKSLQKAIKSSFYIKEMDCPMEVYIIKKVFIKNPNISNISFDLLKQTITITHSKKLTNSFFVSEISKLGMSAETLSKTKDEKASSKDLVLWMRIIPALVLAFLAEFLHIFNGGFFGIRVVVFVLSFCAILISGINTYKKGLVALKNLNLNINALMSIAVTGALFIGEFAEAAMVMSLFSLAEWLEAKSLDRARKSIKNLTAQTPKEVSIRQKEGGYKKVDPKSVSIGQIVRVDPGESLALDGVLISDACLIDESALSGESLPVDKLKGDKVFAGTLNKSFSFEYKVSSLAAYSTFAKIMDAVEVAQSKKAPMQRFIDKFATIYTPVAVLFAFLVVLLPPFFLGAEVFKTWLERGLTVLVIACPCALVISTPVAVVSALRRALKSSMLIKGGIYLEQGRFLKTIALDKTGTITHGKPSLTDTFILKKEPKDALNIAASLAKRSDHPISKAISSHIELKTYEVKEFRVSLGEGSEGVIDGVRYHLGNHKMLHKMGICSKELESKIESFETKGKTVVSLFNKDEVIALFALSDTIKNSSIEAIREFKKLGIYTVMLTGDNKNVAKQIAKNSGVDSFYSELAPQDKSDLIEKFIAKNKRSKNSLLAMVGDGINDTLALTKADIGFAMAKIGSDSAIESADVAIMDDDLRKVGEFIKLSKQTHFILWQNIIFAIGIKILFLLLTIVGLGTMWMAVLADVGTSLIVIANGMRILNKKL